MSSNYYAILGVARSATADEIHSAYRARARELHPDIAGDTPENASKMILVNEAFDVLGAPAARRAYDGSAPAPEPHGFLAFVDRPPPEGFVRLSRDTNAGVWYGSGDLLRRAMSLRALTDDLSALRELGSDELWHLDAGWVTLHDSDIQTLAGFGALEVLRAPRSNITDAGIAHLTALPRLRELDVSGCAITDAAFESFRAMIMLEDLVVFGTSVTDAGVRELAFHPRLAVLDVRKTAVEGECLPALETVPRLRQLRVPRKALRHLRAFAERRPEVEIL